MASYTYKGVTYTTDGKGNKTASSSNSASSNGASSSGKSSSSSNGAGTTQTGYNKGSGYANRETAYTWNDGTTTYSNATNWQDAAREGGKEGVGLSSAVSYASNNLQKANGSNSSDNYYYAANNNGKTDGQTKFTTDIYSKNQETAKNYTNALNHENYVRELYSNRNGEAGINGGYGYQGASRGNPYSGMLEYVQSQYDDFEDQIINMNKDSMALGTRRLENQKKSVNDTYEENARQAYINYLQQQHVLPEVLSAQGITGGATETAQLGLQNNYQNNLTSINNALADAIFEIDNSIAELEQSGNVEMAKQVLANSQAALSAYQGLMQNAIDYDYQAYRDKLSDDRYTKEYADSQAKYESSAQNDEYKKVLSLINNGFNVDNAADILGVDQGELDDYINYLNQLRQLEIDKNQASLAKTLSSIKTSSGSKSSGTSSSKSKATEEVTLESSGGSTTPEALKKAKGFASGYAENGVTISGYGTISLEEAINLYDDGNGPIVAFVNPKDKKIYFSK